MNERAHCFAPQSFAHGWSDGITGLWTEPMEGAKKGGWVGGKHTPQARVHPDIVLKIELRRVRCRRRISRSRQPFVSPVVPASQRSLAESSDARSV